jgi:hypothetical protein
MEIAMSSLTTQDPAFTDFRPGFGARLNEWMISASHHEPAHNRKTGTGSGGFGLNTIASSF